MGWSSGSRLMTDIIFDLKKSEIDFDERKEVYKILIENFEHFDCDTLDECVGEDNAFDAIWNELNPEENEDDEEEYEEDDDYEDD